MFIVQECHDCGHVWKFDTIETVSSYNSQFCPKCDCTKYKLLRADDDE